MVEEKCDTKGCNRKAKWVAKGLDSTTFRCTPCKNLIINITDSEEQFWLKINNK